MENINEEFKRSETISEMVARVKRDNPGKFDHLPDPMPMPQKWSKESSEKLSKILKDRENELRKDEDS